MSAYCVWLILKTNLSHVCERNYKTKTTMQHRTSQMKYAHCWQLLGFVRQQSTSLLNCQPLSIKSVSFVARQETQLLKYLKSCLTFLSPSQLSADDKVLHRDKFICGYDLLSMIIAPHKSIGSYCGFYMVELNISVKITKQGNTGSYKYWHL